MDYSLEHAAPLRKYTLKIFHGGSISQENPYQNYINGEVVYARNLALENASLGLFENIARRLGYKPGSKFYYRESTYGTFSKITNDDLVHDIVNHQLIADRELNIFIVDGVREERQMEITPTIMFWNCRGLNDLKIDELKALCLIYKPNIVFVIESRLSSTFVGKICFKLGFQDFRDSPANRHMEDLNNCVGLAMFHDRSVKLDFLNNSENYLEFIVHLSDSERYRLLCFYGNPKNKNLSREWLKQLSSTSIEDRLIAGGDFNFIVNPREKSGGCEKTLEKMEDTFTECNLDDLSFQGSSIFTWKGNDVRERLDRVVAASTWKDLFPNQRVLHLTDKVTSDHIPILLETDSEKQESKIWDATLFSIREVEHAYKKLKHEENITTVFRLKTSKSDLYYDAMKLVAPHLIELEYIAVLEKDKVTYERLVTLRKVHHIGALFMNSLVSRKPTGEHNLSMLPQFPSHGRDEKIPLNLSEYLVQTWLLIKFIPIDCEEPRQHIVDTIAYEKVNNLITWFSEVNNRYGGLIGNDISKKLIEKASMIGLAMIVYDNIISLLEKQKIKDEGAITDIISGLKKMTQRYFGATTDTDSSKIVDEPIQFLLKTFKWRQSKDPSQYRITDTDREEQFAVLTKHMLEADRDVVMIQNPWIQKLVEDIKREELEKQVKEVIHHQLELLQEVGCITCSKEDGIVLSKSDGKDRKSVIDRLHKAASDALKMVSKNKKSTTYETYKHKLRQAYTKSENNKKRERGGERHGEKKPKF